MYHDEKRPKDDNADKIDHLIWVKKPTDFVVEKNTRNRYMYGAIHDDHSSQEAVEL